MSRVLFTLHVAIVMAGLIFVPKIYGHSDHAAKARINADKGTIAFFRHHPWMWRPRHTRDIALGATEIARHRLERMQPKLPTTTTGIIYYVFGSYGGQAIRVASCESGLRTNASNGQYQGMFQMGSRERAIYGHGYDVWSQVRAAYRYFVASGRDWSPWECKP